jgi:hypothetical protein
MQAIQREVWGYQRTVNLDIPGSAILPVATNGLGMASSGAP